MALLLAIETSGASGDIALLRHGEIVGRRRLLLARRHNEELLGHVQALLSAVGAGVGQLDAVAYGSGPGSFTGVRLAAAATVAMAWAHGLPVFAIGSAEALAHKAWLRVGSPPEYALEVRVVLDARVQQVYDTTVRMDVLGAVQAGPTRLLGWPRLAALAQPAPGFIAIGDAWSDARMPAALLQAAGVVLANESPEAPDVGALAWRRWIAGERPAAGAELPGYIRGADAWAARA